MGPALRSRTARAAAAVPVLLLVLAGCNGDTSEPAASGASASGSSAPPSPSDTPTEAEVTQEAQDEPPAGQGTWDEGTLVPAMMAAMADQRTAHFRMTTSGGGADVDAEGEMAFRGKTADMAMTMSGATLGAASMEIRSVDQVVYLSMPPMTPKGKFVEIRPGDTSSPFAGMTDQMQVDPRDSVRAFEAGLRKVTYLGEESVRGEDLERYRLTVDFGAVAKAQGIPRTADMPKTVDYLMWLDDRALMRRMELEVMTVGMVMEMSQWGEPVSIEAPARRDVVAAPGQ
ncbi:MAG TPA: hypothetical protein VFR87_12180 [Nocardioidaceae bacterium]|nr:hypothetical protein [Nocardioidaceae bacterium]